MILLHLIRHGERILLRVLFAEERRECSIDR
jgi:hypothetical protein